MPSPDLPETTLAARIRAEAAAFRLRSTFEYLRSKAGFNPNQPRVPAGNPDGGRWTDARAGHASSSPARTDSRAPASADAKPARTVTRVVHDRSGDRPWSSYTESRSQSDGKLVSRTVTNRDDGRQLSAEWIGQRTEAEIGQLCKRYGLVRKLTDHAAASSPRTAYRSAASRGTAIHLKVKQGVDRFADKNFRAELSILKSTEDAGAKIRNYCLKDTIRIDVLERLGGLVCIYDLKTGQRGLSAPRIREIAHNVFSVYPETQQMLIIEVRPSD